MDRNRKILLSILLFLVFSIIIALIDMGTRENRFSKGMPSFRLMQTGPGIGIINIEGEIQTGSSTGFKTNLGSDAIIEQLSELEANPNIRAIVIRINSPGGSVAASQEIYEKIMSIRKRNIPVFASMADVAASGAYYIASACNKIYANAGTITGSIGVIMLSVDIQKLLERFGISVNVIKSGKHKDIFSSVRDITPQEKQMIQEMIDSMHQKFLKDIAVGRNMSISDIEPVADGRILTGEAALENKLIDHIGTFEETILAAKLEVKLPADAAVYRKRMSTLEQILMSMRLGLTPKIKINDLFKTESFILQ
jgi:protease-4